MLKDPFTGEPSMSFTLYAMEQEGDVDTDLGKRKRVMKNLKELAKWTVVDENTVRDEFFDVMLYLPTEEEIVNILREVLN